MDKLWAPWRINYIQKKARAKCIFCHAKNTKATRVIVFTTRHSLCLLNIYPYNNGHLMVSPKRHCKTLGQLHDKETMDLMKALIKAQSLLDTVLKPHGYNIGINLSACAGAGIPGHLHIHIVPRWKGDTNFMPVIHNTKIISQSLDELYARLTHAYTKTD